ncbi:MULTISPECIES: MlaA family lipoprotein [Agarivorans]|uniref:Surface lipoprotein VacJ n=1 Tax=Agarivorans albus MKT 106 TaxID=1331007 RepID=R9PKQ3_AGAAL|nr:VacJ family lipoprotein [Agarivorans albus]GAD01910.1 surface lipoprotein VacJ [Agarivorans albus MKT 106]
MRKVVTAFLMFAVMLSTASTTMANEVEAFDEPYQDFSDPFEGFNRSMWNFNYNYLDKPLYRPVTHVYAEYLPFGIREAMNNVIRNLEEPASFANHLLQGKVERASNNLVRFLFNSSFGIFGIFDLMGRSGVQRDIEEFGDVMGFYGVPEGPYVMLPVLGPTTVRKEVGDWVDAFASPLTNLTFAEQVIKWGLDGLYKRASVIEQEPLLDNSLDSYTFVKDAYLQYRLYRFYNGKPPTSSKQDIDSALEDYLDELEDY